jgi:4-aminobutyrate aminotransferase-like enzyme
LSHCGRNRAVLRPRQVLRFLPPLTISDELLIEGLDVLALVLADL